MLLGEETATGEWVLTAPLATEKGVGVLAASLATEKGEWALAAPLATEKGVGVGQWRQQKKVQLLVGVTEDDLEERGEDV